MKALIEIRNVHKAYRRGTQTVPVLSGLSLDVAAGEYLALMGPSGSGKSTLLNLIAGIDQIDSGSLRVGGIELGELPERRLADWRAANVGFIFQFYNLMPVLSAFENVELPLRLCDLTGRERRERVLAALDRVGLTDRQEHAPSELSGGQQQRVAIARALITEPALIVADEPTGDLDRDSATEVLKLLQELNEQTGTTIVMVTHDQRAAAHAHSIMRLEKGQLTTATERR
jgi:putative ABC transport system ATP-binding protein